MRNTRALSLLLLCIVVSTLVFFFNTGNTRAVTGNPEGQPLVPAESPRLVVELESAPLAVAYKSMAGTASADGTLDADSAAGLAYIAQLQAEQAAFVSALQAVLPEATVSTFVNELGTAEQATYQVVFNGVGLDVGSMDREEARQRISRMPGVKAVHLDQAYQTQLYTSTALINAPQVWDMPEIGGVENAGEGIRFASIDGGIHKDAPMFSGEGYTYPQGYEPNGLGLTANNNGKIIVSRVYFRPWDPPAPGDENPWPGVNGTSHGVHTASIAAGNCVEDVTYAGFEIEGGICGVAPRAYVMSYRVFYASVNGNESFYTVEGLAALEDAVRDGAQVVNNSWGAGPLSEGGEFDPLDTALINAVEAGVFVSMSAGNAGPGLGTGDHPSDDYINVAASTTSGTLATGRVSISAPSPVPPESQNFPFSPAEFGEPLPIGVTQEYTFVTSSAVDPGNVEGCNAFPPNAFDGKAAVISRGGCFFSEKVFNAQQAGAVFAVIYNNAGEDLINMGCGEGTCAEITIPSLFIGQSNGQKMVNWYNTHTTSSRFEFNSIAFQTGNDPDEVVAFSSRGPAVGNLLKPDILAPGVNILAQGYTPGATGEARHLGYGQVSGTSMASPHVAGSAILLRQLFPGWEPGEIKSALMSTAKYLDIYTDDGAPAQPLDMGAGRVDVAAATNPGVILDPPSVSIGQIATGTVRTVPVEVTNITSAAETYQISTLYTGDGFTDTVMTELPGFTVSPASLSLAPGETKTISITFTAADSRGLGDNQGFIILDGSEHEAHMPAWARVMYAEPLADVLIIDNDFSSEVGNPDYLAYYTDALEELGLTYNVIDTVNGVGQDNTIPDATTLAAYRAVIFYTGDNYQPDGTFTVSTGLTELDMDRLVEYLNGGGALLAMGQDLAAALGADETDSTSAHILYTARLGANWIQDSVTDGETPSALIVPPDTAPEVFADVFVDLTEVRRYSAEGELSGLEETPPITDTETTGSFEITYDVDQNWLEFEVTVVPTPTAPITVTAAHIHNAPPGVPGSVVRGLDLEGELPQFVTDTLTLSGVISDLTPTEVEQMLAGDFYVNVHTSDHPDGEVRGQIELEPEANQPYVDEIDNEAHDGSQEPGDSDDNRASREILEYNGPQIIYDGTVALVYRDQPTLENPGISYRGRSVYAAFGLEGMSNDFSETFGITPTTRAELLDLFLDWTWSEPGEVTISAINEVTTSATVIFSATLSSADAAAVNAPEEPEAVRYRWDFGDGSSFISSSGNTAGHTYQCGEENTHTVRVEIEDQYGNLAIGSMEFDASEVCAEEPTTEFEIQLPIIKLDDGPDSAE